MKILSGNPMYNRFNEILFTELMERIRHDLRKHRVDEDDIQDISDDLCFTIADVMDGTYEVDAIIHKVKPFIGYFKNRDGIFYIGPDETSTPMVIVADYIP